MNFDFDMNFDFENKKKKVDIKYPEKEGIEGEALDEIVDLQNAFTDSVRATANSKKIATDTEYYSVIYFKTEEQKIEFFTKINALSLISNGNKFIKGEKLADVLEIIMDERPIKIPKKFATPKFNS